MTLKIGLVSFLILAAAVAGEQPLAPTDPLLDAMQAELGRTVSSWQGAEDAPYYLGYRVSDVRQVSLSARYGALATDDDDHRRTLDVSARVGSPALDSTHRLRDEADYDSDGHSPQQLPIDGGVSALRAGIWRATSDEVASAQQAILRVRMNHQVKVAESDPSPDFSVQTPTTSIEPLAELSIDTEAWKAALVGLSRRLDKDPRIERSSADLSALAENKYVVTSEGTAIRQGRTWYRVALQAQATADDGMQVELYRWKDVAQSSRLPPVDALNNMADALVSQVLALRQAPAGDPYSGPVILRGAAAGVFVHEVMGHRVEGHRQKDEEEGQTFRGKVGQVVLPASIDVYDDPGLASYAGFDLNGHYRFDEEGVPGARADLVAGGVFRGFLTYRSPIQGFPNSNGHGRAQEGAAPVARMANTILETHAPVPYAELRKQLIAEVKRQGRPFGLVVDELAGGFTMTGRSFPNSFDVLAETVWRVYPDGRPDELVRGVELIGTPLVALSHVLAAGDDPAVFNGFCGAESGYVPNAAVSPSLLISQLEIQKKEKSQDRPPLLPKPHDGGTAGVMR